MSDAKRAEPERTVQAGPIAACGPELTATSAEPGEWRRPP